MIVIYIGHDVLSFIDKVDDNIDYTDTDSIDKRDKVLDLIRKWCYHLKFMEVKPVIRKQLKDVKFNLLLKI